MRNVPLPLVCLAVLSASAQDAGAGAPVPDRCIIEAKKYDRVAKGKDVIVEAGDHVEDAIAVEGNVYVRRGARVKQAIALHGSVIVEAGARVTGSVVAIGGRITVSPDAQVEGSQLSLDDGLRIVGETGRELQINASLDGVNLAREILKPMLEEFHDCGVISLK